MVAYNSALLSYHQPLSVSSLALLGIEPEHQVQHADNAHEEQKHEPKNIESVSICLFHAASINKFTLSHHLAYNEIARVPSL
jgi:hypothetical protein